MVTREKSATSRVGLQRGWCVSLPRPAWCTVVLVVVLAATWPGAIGFNFRSSSRLELCRAGTSNYNDQTGLTMGTDFLTTAGLEPLLTANPTRDGEIISNASQVDLSGNGVTVAAEVSVPSNNNDEVALMTFTAASATVLEIFVTADASVVQFALGGSATRHSFVWDTAVSSDVNWVRSSANGYFRVMVSLDTDFATQSPTVVATVSQGELTGSTVPTVIKRGRASVSATGIGMASYWNTCYHAGANASCTTTMAIGVGIPNGGCMRHVNVSTNVVGYAANPPTSGQQYGARCTCPDGASYTVAATDSSCGTTQCDGGIVNLTADTCVAASTANVWQSVRCTPDDQVNVYMNSRSSTNPVAIAWRVNISQRFFNGSNIGNVEPSHENMGFGGFGQVCECPNGMRYNVGDLFNGCGGEVACFGGTAVSSCFRNVDFSNHGVVCATGDTRGPTAAPTGIPTTSSPTTAPTVVPTASPTNAPTPTPRTDEPTNAPTAQPSNAPTAQPTEQPTVRPTEVPTSAPTAPTDAPTARPTAKPTFLPTALPTTSPTSVPTTFPTALPTATPTAAPTAGPTAPTSSPTAVPSAVPTAGPTFSPTAFESTEATGGGGSGPGSIIYIIVVIVAMSVLIVGLLVRRRQQNSKPPGRLSPEGLGEGRERVNTVPMVVCAAHRSIHSGPPSSGPSSPIAVVDYTSPAEIGMANADNAKAENLYSNVAVEEEHAYGEVGDAKAAESLYVNAELAGEVQAADGQEHYAVLDLSGGSSATATLRRNDDTVLYTQPVVPKRASASSVENYAAMDFSGDRPALVDQALTQDDGEVVYSAVTTGC